MVQMIDDDKEYRMCQLFEPTRTILIIDDEVFLLGASVKDMGAGLCAITKMQTTPETVLALLE